MEDTTMTQFRNLDDSDDVEALTVLQDWQLVLTDILESKPVPPAADAANQLLRSINEGIKEILNEEETQAQAQTGEQDRYQSSDQATS